MQGYAWWSLALVLRGTYQMHVAGLWSGDVELDSMSDALKGPLLRHILCAAVAWMSPVSSNTVNAHALYVAFVVGSICDQWLHTGAMHHMATRSSNLSGNILFAAFLGIPGRAFVLNLLVLCSTLLRSFDWDDDPGVFDPLQGAILSVVCAVVAQRFLQSEARALVAAMSSASTESAVQDLLGMMCDAVVVLDEHLVMASPCPKLDALLLRLSKTFGDMEPFPSLFQVADHDRIVHFLSGYDGAAQCLHASLMDVRGTRVRVQLFHKGFDSVFGQSRHVIGVLEACALRCAISLASLREHGHPRHGTLCNTTHVPVIEALHFSRTVSRCWLSRWEPVSSSTRGEGFLVLPWSG